MKVIKSSGDSQDFCLDKIVRAVNLANKSVPEETRMNDANIQKVVSTVQKKLEGFTSISVEMIHEFVEDALMKHNKYDIARAYITYREEKKKRKKYTETEEKAISLKKGTSNLRGDNANKHIDDNSSLRDYLAGLVCKSIFSKTTPKDIITAHNRGLIHWHDADYSPFMPMHNCFLGSQKFITDKGIRAFNEFTDGETVYVRDSENVLRKATVHKYEKQPMNEVVFTLRNDVCRTVHCTANHTWILEDGTRTTNLCVGDKLLPNTTYKNTLEIENDDDAKYWCYGFILGDGCDKAGVYSQVRLCGSKNRFLENFKKAGIFHFTSQNDDVVPYTKWFSKQECLNNHGWRMLTARQKAFMFLGYYSADGRQTNSSVYVSDDRMCDFIEDCSGLAGYYITSMSESYRDTNYKLNAHGYYYHFLRPQTNGCTWRVKSISSYSNKRLKETWCIVEPVTHSFMLEGGIPTGNCDLCNAEDMFKNGFMMGDTRIEPDSETPFSTACTLLSQINLQLSGKQYGGQTVSWSHTLPFIANSRRLIRKEILDDVSSSTYAKCVKFVNKVFGTHFAYMPEKKLHRLTEKKLRKEIYTGVKTYQYQVLCHCSSNGQTPFVSNNLCLREAQTQQELEDFAMLIEEIFKRRIKGVKDESGHYASPLFPKLLYWTCDGLNVNPDDPYYYLTELASECIVKRMQPDIVSERETRRVKEGQIIPSMGCRSLLAPIWEENTYPVDTKFYWYEGAGTYPYGTFVEKTSMECLANGVYPTGYKDGQISINFRGNTGWLKEKTDTTVTIIEPKVYGRWNNGVVTINLPHVALEARKQVLDESADGTIDHDKIMKVFYEILDDRLELCRRALQLRYKSCEAIKGMNSAILWMHGALARMDAEDTVGDLMKKYPQRASISLGFTGLYETCRALINESNTTDKGRILSKEILTYMNHRCAEWKDVDHMNYSIYGTPQESLTAKLADANRRDFGVIEYITDKDYVVNSYHVDPRENIDAFTKLKIEGEYLALSSGGAVSYVEIPEIKSNTKAIQNIIRFMHSNIVYAEFNRKIGICYECGHEGDMNLVKTEDGEFKFICPVCGNSDDSKMSVTARLCGYIGKVNAGNTNKGRLDDIYNRVIHLDNFDEIETVKDCCDECE